MTTALVVGSAATVWEDLAAARALGRYVAVIAVNEVGIALKGRIAAWVSQHPDHMAGWIAERKRRRLSPAKLIIGSHRRADRPGQHPGARYTDHRFPGQEKSGSSGLFGLKVALIDLGFDRAVLCGVPISTEAGHINPEQRWPDHLYRPGWLQSLPQIADRARSMSGWTREILGAPTAEWIAG